MAGTTITINGSNFTGASNVMIGGQSATFTVVSPTQITATVPAGATGTNLSVTTGAGTGSTVGFAPAPTISTISPNNAPVGTPLTITGTNFIPGAVGTVIIGGQTATFTVVSPTQITTTVPVGATGSGVDVTTVSGTVNNAGFTVNTNVPTISSLVVPNTMAGTSITINGTNFTGASNVTIGGQTATFTVVSPTQITATVPAGAVGTNLSVTTGAGTGNTVGFAPAPTITSFSPSSAAPGATITLTGTNFITGAVGSVVIGGQTATFTVVSPTQITATVPAGATGSGATVMTVSGVGSNAGFSVNIPPPPVVVVPPTPAPPTAPTSFQLGATPTLQSSLNLPYALTLVANGSPTPTYSFVSGTLPPGMSVSATGVISGVPSRQGTYTFTVQANNSAGSASSVVTVVVGAPRPLATFVDQTTGGIGTVVVIRGYNFSNATGVSFGGIPALRFTVDNANQITAIVGAGNSGEIIVSTPEGSSSAPQGFVYTAPQVPVITGINPVAVQSGDEDYSIVLRGENFSQYATYLVQPETGTNASFSVPLPVVIESVVAGEARLRLPLASRTIGVKRLVVRIADIVVSSTFAVVTGVKPQILSQTVPATTATSRAFTTELIGTGFFRRGFASITVDGLPANASVLESNRARVEIPASLNILGSRVRVRLTNYDGQFAETVVNVVSRVAPLISAVQSRLENGRIRFIAQGSGFWGVQSVMVQNRTVLLVRTSPTELEIELPSDFQRPRVDEESWVLMVENPDGQKYGFRIAPNLFYPSGAGLSVSQSSNSTPKNSSATNAATASQNIISTSNNALLGQVSVSPNPVSEMLTVSAPSFTGQGRWQMVNVRGEVVLSGVIAGGERLPVDVRSLASGGYVLRIVGEGVQVLSRVAVLR
jgi:hypothetical protein